MSKRMCVSCESDRANLVRAEVRACVSVCVCETANAVCGSRVCASTRSARHVGSRISGASTRRHERRRSSGPRARAAGTVSVRRRVYGVVSYASLFCVRALYRAGVCERSWGRERRCRWLITFSLLRTYYIGTLLACGLAVARRRGEFHLHVLRRAVWVCATLVSRPEGRRLEKAPPPPLCGLRLGLDA